MYFRFQPSPITKSKYSQLFLKENFDDVFDAFCSKLIAYVLTYDNKCKL